MTFFGQTAKAANKAVGFLRTFCRGVGFRYLCFAVSAISVLFSGELFGAAITLLLMSVHLCVIRETSSLCYPILMMTVSLFTTSPEQIKNAPRIAWFLLPFFAAAVYNIIRYQKHFQKNRIFLPMLAVSVAVTVGGLFSVSAEDYFSIGGLYYVGFLGFGMVLLCALFYTLWDGERTCFIREDLTGAMTDAGIFLAVVMLMLYLENLGEFLNTGHLIRYLSENPIRNVAAGFYILSLPFVFFRAKERERYLFAALLIYIACLFSGSRMGLLFGTAEFLFCLIYLFIFCKKMRLGLGILAAALCLGAFLVWEDLYGIYEERVVDGLIHANEMRLTLWRRAIDDFRSAPMFGRGLGYSGNNDVYPVKTFEILWYHNFLCQIIGSLGLCGVAAYLYQYYVRLWMILRRHSDYGWLCCLVYIAAILQSLTDTGIFAPFPTVFLLNLTFLLLARGNQEMQTTQDALIKND